MNSNNSLYNPKCYCSLNETERHTLYNVHYNVALTTFSIHEFFIHVTPEVMGIHNKRVAYPAPATGFI